MPSTSERREIAWTRRSPVGVVIVLLAITLLGSGGVSELVSSERYQVSPAASAEADSGAIRERPPCPADEVPITRADVGIGDALRCLPVGGAEVEGSRIDLLYSRVAAGLIKGITQAEGFAGTVKVICWSKDDWRNVSDAFRDAGQLEPLEYWLGWVRGEQGVINLSYPACKHLDDIAYRNGQLTLHATGAAVGTLAHEAMHIAGFYDEGIADCYAMQLTAVTASRLGAEREYADELQTLNHEFSQDNRSGTEYDSPDCYDGGPLDLAPENPRWP